MVGNDIIDIEESKKNSNWERPRFLEKLFTDHEQQLIRNSDNSFLMVWRLWSMKEAAYKLYIQLHPSRFYRPKQFECFINNIIGNVKYRDFECPVNTKITSGYIVSEAYINNSNVTSRYIKLKTNNYKIQNQTIKAALFSLLAKRHNVLKSELRILKSEFGIPSIYINSKKLNISISISHHGNYGAYAILQL